MNRRTFLEGLFVTAAGLVLPYEPKRVYSFPKLKTKGWIVLTSDIEIPMGPSFGGGFIAMSGVFSFTPPKDTKRIGRLL